MTLLVSGVDPGWGNDLLPVLVSGLAGTVEQVRCQEIFDYSTYDGPDGRNVSLATVRFDGEPTALRPGQPLFTFIR